MRALVKFGLFLHLAAALLIGCASDDAAVVPANAIPLGDKIYLVPLLEPVEGCPAFRAFSSEARVLQAIYFRTAVDHRETEGAFTFDRNKAECW